MEPSLSDFVMSLLGLLGADQVALRPDLIRVYPHPSLEELVGDAAWVDLALTEQALRENPAAAPCAPGSFALDSLLRRARELPSVFHTEMVAADSAPEGPPGLVCANGELQPRGESAQRRWLVYAIFRIQVQSDELIEKIVSLVVDETGQARPGWASTVEESRREAASDPDGPARVEVRGEVWTALADEASRLAREIAGSLAPELEARKAAEIARLDAYLRGQRDDLAAELPAGAARRAAQIEVESREVADAARLRLPGAGPWPRDALLRAPARAGRPWHSLFSKRHEPVVAAPPAPDPRFAEPLRALAARLPSPFTWQELASLLQRDAEKRLERLERRASDGPSPREVLAEREARLLEEHRTRLAEIEERHQLRVLVRPALVERLTYPAVLHRSGVADVEAAEVVSTWHALTGGWELPACPACREPLDSAGALGRLWRCERGHLCCETCVCRCPGCSRARCPNCRFATCTACGQPACDECGASCPGCGKWYCARHFIRCPECGGAWCSGCGGACAACGSPLCREHHASCAVCKGGLCATHTVECALCQATGCPEHGGTCDSCGRGFCQVHGAPCSLCRQISCSSCIGAGGACEVCRSLEEAGPETVRALQAWLAEAEPGLRTGAFRRWRVGRGVRRTVIVTRGWTWDHVFVLDQESRALVSRRRRWFWQSG